jgi:hypothetical protein
MGAKSVSDSCSIVGFIALLTRGGGLSISDFYFEVIVIYCWLSASYVVELSASFVVIVGGEVL